MIKQGSGGKILGAASIVAFKPFALLSHYSASKWAVRGMTQAFAMEMAEHKITVNAYAPGIVGTAMWDLIDEELSQLEQDNHLQNQLRGVEENLEDPVKNIGVLLDRMKPLIRLLGAASMVWT